MPYRPNVATPRLVPDGTMYVNPFELDNPQFNPDDAPQLDADKCNCAKPKKKKPKKREPRVTCKAGTYQQTARGVVYHPNRIVPCT